MFSIFNGDEKLFLNSFSQIALNNYWKKYKEL